MTEVKSNNQEKNQNKKQNKKIAIGAAILVAAVVVLAGVYMLFSQKPVAGEKHIILEVTDDVQKVTAYEVDTDAEYLRQAMEDTRGLIFSGEEGEFGIMVDTINGVKADYNTNGAYWGFMINGAYCNYGVDQQPVADGDKVQIIYTAATAQ